MLDHHRGVTSTTPRVVVAAESALLEIVRVRIERTIETPLDT
jgi:hypothetical protein